MGSFLQNNQAYNIRAEGQLASILSSFDTDYVIGIMEDILANQLNDFNPVPKANIINSFEDNFKAILNDYPEDKPNILDIRESTYSLILSKIAKAFNFEFRDTDQMDLYSIAKLLYDFFVSNYNGYLINFMADYIIREQDTLYKVLNMEQFKKDKDVTTIYNKKLFDSVQMAIVSSHLDYVVKYMMDMDFTMEQVLTVTYRNNPYHIAAFMQHVFPKMDFYKDYYCRLISVPNIYPIIVTYLKIDLQRRCLPADTRINLNF